MQLHPHPEFHFEVNGTTTVATVALPHDGEFELQTSGHNWLDAVGNRLDANGDGTGGGIRRIPFTARRGDANLDGLVDASDIDAICAALHANRTDHRFDMNGDSNVDRADINAIVEDVFETSFGDANLDGRFDSTDLVLIFQKAKYEDDIPNNATWTDGDWNCDGEFDTQDFVVAFQSGGYVRAARSFQSPGEAVPGIDYEARHARR